MNVELLNRLPRSMGANTLFIAALLIIFLLWLFDIDFVSRGTR
jgi:hypothetical protein